jgi:hypothetical protein
MPFVILVNAENTNIIRQTQSLKNKRKRFHVVHSNVGLRPPSRGNYNSSLTPLMSDSTGLRKLYQCTLETDY